jgi:hypothetical protein
MIEFFWLIVVPIGFVWLMINVPSIRQATLIFVGICAALIGGLYAVEHWPQPKPPAWDTAFRSSPAVPDGLQLDIPPPGFGRYAPDSPTTTT